MDPTLSQEKKPRARKSNFSPEEISLLIDEGVQHNSILSAAFGPGITKKTKDTVWESIASKISANTAGIRSAGEVRKKWNDIRCQVKKRAQVARREAVKTGGGPSSVAALNELDEKVLSTIPTCQIQGIDGGVETPICTEDQPPTTNLAIENGDEASLPQESAAALGGQVDEIAAPSTSTSTSSMGSLITQLDKSKKSVSRALPTATAKATSTTTSQGNTSSSHVGSLVKVEESKLVILRQLLCVERERLDVERERLALERDRLSLERQRLEIEQKSLNSSVDNFLTPVISFE